MFASSKSGAVADPTDNKFNYVTMLLHGNGSNGAQNNTFVDSSTNNFSITRNGNTTQGTFSPYGSNWSNYFDGSGDYLTVPNSTAFDLSTSNFTIEGFFYPTVGSSFQSIFAYASNAGASVSDYAFQLLINSSNGVNFRVVASGSSSFTTISTSNTITLNSWNYVCVTRTGTSVSVYLNGTTTTGTIASTIRNNASSILTIGRDPDGSYAINGYLSNLRILKGTAVTPTTPTTPLTAITNTSLLTCADNRFIDDSTNNFTITRNGDVSVQRFSPFAPTSAYSTSVIGGSGYFDGTGDYLSAADNAAFDLGSSDFTIEGWVFLSSSGSSQTFVAKGTGADNQASYHIVFNGTNWLYYLSGNGSTWSIASGVTMGAGTANTWQHLALVRSGSTFTPYVNGTAGTTTSSATALFDGNKVFSVGADDAANQRLTGYISNTRVVKGTAVYTASFTPPTAPLTAITNTSLLLNYTNPAILDNAMMNDLETVGNAQISTSVKKYGTGSLAFDGTGDYLTIPSSQSLGFGTGDFTIEGWLYLSSTSAYSTIISNRTSGGDTTTGRYSVAIRSTAFEFYANGSQIVSAGTVSTSTWTHFAVTRASNNIRLFLNGTQVGSTTAFTTDLSTLASYVGANGAGTEPLTGNIDDLRITKGVARYTANFTAPTTAFADKG
jgi:hypothetical protein